MRIGRRDLTFKALCALHEIAQQAAVAPVKPSFMLRFLLAYLYAVSDAPAWLPKQIWRDLRQPDDRLMSGDMASYARRSSARNSFGAMVRHCGFDPSVAGLREFEEYMNRNGTPEQRDYQQMRDAASEGRAKPIPSPISANRAAPSAQDPVPVPQVADSNQTPP